jgi:sugar-phosphatase
VVFEDTPAGVKSGKAAGMRVIALKTTYPATELGGADAVLGSLENVTVSFPGGVLHVDLP